MKLATEAPVNGGRNYDGPKVNSQASLGETWPYAGKSEYPTLLLAREVITRWVQTISRKDLTSFLTASKFFGGVFR